MSKNQAGLYPLFGGVVGIADWFGGEFGQGTQSYVGTVRVRYAR